MAAMFVPRSVTRKADNNLSHKSNAISTKKSHLKKIEIIDERKLATKERQRPMESDDPGASTNLFASCENTEETCVKDISRDDMGKGEDEEVEKVVLYSKNQRWPAPGEPVCVICGRYGAYIVDQTDRDVCSLECKARQLNCALAEEHEELPDSSAENRRASRRNASSNRTIAEISVAENKFQFHYNEHPVIAKLSASKVDDIREALNIRVKGNNVSRPILEFKHCRLSKTLESNLIRFGYATPTPVQMQVIPVGLSSRDALVGAHTGSGKTAAFLVPIIQRIYAEVEFSFSMKRLSYNPIGVIMSPTRELCMQTEKQAKELMQGLPNMKTALLVGGMPIPPQLHRLSSGVQIIVATPGRMREIVNAESGVDLSSVKVFVLDEVDIMLQMGFEQQVQEVIDKLPAEKQTLMFSATVPTYIEIVADKLLVNPVYISVGSPSEPNASIKQIVLWVEEQFKKKHLFSLLQDPKYFMPPVVVFVNSKMGADLLAEAIQKVVFRNFVIE